MPLWMKIPFRIVGVLNLLISIDGFYLIGRTVSRVIYMPEPPGQPHFLAVFFSLTTFNLAFLIALLVTSIEFLRLREQASKHYAFAVASLLSYELLSSVFSVFVHGGVARTVGGAWGIGNMGTALFELFPFPFVYPILTVVIVLLITKYSRSGRQRLTTA